MRNILLIAALFLCTATRAQTGAIMVRNLTNCEAYVTMIGNDPGVFGTTCDMVSNPIWVPAGGNMGYPSYCWLETSVGWLTSPGAVCPTFPSTTFQWTEARITFGTCYTTAPFTPPFCSAPVGSGLISSPAGSCYSMGTHWDDGITCLQAEWTGSTTAPYDVDIFIHR